MPQASEATPGAERVNGADRTATHPYPEVPPQRPAQPGRPADSSDLPPGHDHEEPTDSALSGHDDRQPAQAQGHPAGANVAGETSDTGNDGVSARDPQSTATGQETPASGQEDNPGEAVTSDDATKLPKASSDQGESQDPVEEADTTEALKRRIAELQASNAELKAANTDLEAESAAKDAVIAEQQDAIETKDSTIDSQWRKIIERDYRVEDLEKENGRLKDEKAAPGAGEGDPEHGADVPEASQDQNASIDELEATGQEPTAKTAKTVMKKVRKAVSSDNLQIAKDAVVAGAATGAATQNPTWGVIVSAAVGVIELMSQVIKKNEKKK
jgi:hypothetical protein